MCELCNNVVNLKEGYYEARYKGGDFIFEEDGEICLYIDTGDSGCPGTMSINYCPMCGRKLVEDQCESM